MFSSTQNRLRWRILQDFKLRILAPSELADFCARGFDAVGDQPSFDLINRCQNKNLVVALMPTGLLFEPQESEPPYSQGGNIFVFHAGVENDIVAGLVLSRSEEKWRAWPSTLSRDEIVEYGRFYSIDCEWIEVLHWIAVSEYTKALHYDEMVSHDYWSFSNEFYARSNSFRFRIRSALFRNKKDFLAWNVALFWDEWENNAVTPDDRIFQLSQVTHCKIDGPMLEHLSPALVMHSIRLPHFAFKDSLSHSVLIQEGLAATAEMSRHHITFEEVQSNGYTEYQPVSSNEYLFFSFGGPAELSFDSPQTNAQTSLLGPFPNESILRDQLWWWRNIPNWTELAEKIFLDNFESSAFSYELAARCLHGRQWQPFGMPWVKLSNFQRGMLNTMWPTKRYGRYTFIPERFLGDFKHDGDHVLIPVDLRVPQADVLTMVTEIHRRERLKRNLPDPGGRRKKEESSCWEVIELLDRKSLLGQELKRSEEDLVGTVIERLHDDAEKLGIPFRV